MADILPPSFLFQAVVEAKHLPAWPKKASLKLFDDLSPIAGLGRMDEDKPPLDVRIGWHEDGLAIGVEVGGKYEPARAEPLYHENDDRLVIGIDSRDTKTIHRAGRFCHRFHVTPCDEDGEFDPSITAELIPRATEDAPLASFGSDAVAAGPIDHGYRVCVLIRGSAINGYDPSFSDRIGVQLELNDRELGTVPLFGDAKMPNGADPSLWPSVRLLP